MDRGAWRATVHGATGSDTTTQEEGIPGREVRVQSPESERARSAVRMEQREKGWSPLREAPGFRQVGRGAEV